MVVLYGMYIILYVVHMYYVYDVVRMCVYTSYVCRLHHVI